MRRQPDTNYDLSTVVTDSIPWFRQQLLAWSKKYGRSFPWRNSGRTPYEILVAEILLQRTTATNVAQGYLLFLRHYPSWAVLAQETLEGIQEALKPFGLWRQKALVFQSLAHAMEDRQGNVPMSRIELEALPGVGQYIAGAVLTTLYNQAEPFIDVNMDRLLGRFFGPRKLADIRDDPYLQTLARRVVEGRDSLCINWAILDFSALVCKPNRPLCGDCPLKTKCQAFDQWTRQ